jgi:RimJ/RimL family protein N-acetyltransferase
MLCSVWHAAELRPVLEGALVRLEPLEERHRAQLHEAAREPETWRWMPLNASASPEIFDRYFERALDRGESEMFATIDLASGSAIGATGYHALRPEHRGLEIGGTWLRPEAWRTGANRETKLLLLGHAFGALDCIRVQDRRAQRALARGARGNRCALRGHLPQPHGRPRRGDPRQRLLQHHRERMADGASETGRA